MSERIDDRRLIDLIASPGPKDWPQTEDIATALRELQSLRKPGYVLVPVEPTGEMWFAGKRVFVPMRMRIFNAIKLDEAFALDDIAPLEIYRAMLAAAHTDGEKP